MMKEFAGRVAAVTGGASGIGRAMAERFAAEGMKIVLADVEEAALSAAVDELKSRGAAVIGVKTDVSRQEEVAALAEKAVSEYGAVHVLCNNAGVAGDSAPSWELELETWQWVFGVNLWGVIHGIRSFVPAMIRNGEPGHVVNTASLAGLLSLPYIAPY
ncbi:MAG TPA: SDR family NAD(P)-dependent oxidoreductase, partial [Blastocatellia bacterium]|nr:SDR family NAD(P)-dependent oxidoreductase [Blastocatellia bacterium]